MTTPKDLSRRLDTIENETPSRPWQFQDNIEHLRLGEPLEGTPREQNAAREAFPSILDVESRRPKRPLGAEAPLNGHDAKQPDADPDSDSAVKAP